MPSPLPEGHFMSFNRYPRCSGARTEHSGLVWRDHMIDIGEALDLLDWCVRDRGEDYRSAATDRIVPLALRKAGAPLTAVSPLARTRVADIYASDRHNPLNLTLGAVMVLSAAESAERDEQTWEIALQAALRAASRFLELIPDP